MFLDSSLWLKGWFPGCHCQEVMEPLQGGASWEVSKSSGVSSERLGGTSSSLFLSPFFLLLDQASCLLVHISPTALCHDGSEPRTDMESILLLTNSLKNSLPWNNCLGEVDVQHCFLFCFHFTLTYRQHPSRFFVFPSNFIYFTVIVWIGSLTFLS